MRQQLATENLPPRVSINLSRPEHKLLRLMAAEAGVSHQAMLDAAVREAAERRGLPVGQR